MRALNEGGGRAAVVKARVPDDEAGRLAAVAARLRITRSATVRRALAIGLAALERRPSAEHESSG
ncbi:MAG TPA: ribbon-helix-helix protein, CopG family [Streptosporangiaceae bacterium]|nr:ribbon-helix-helix protein, CopG family [Streptosporangiaceae bacterium]